MIRERGDGKKGLRIPSNSFIRFLISGGLNTAATYISYLLLLLVTNYRISYTISYVLGIGIAYWLNRTFVFKAHKGLVSILTLPLVYVFQYLFGLAVLWFWVEWLGLGEVYGPVVVVALSVPMTYALTRLIFVARGKAPGEHPTQ